MREVSVTEFKATCLNLIEKVRVAGVSILITKNGKPAALLSPSPNVVKTKVSAGALKGRGRVLGDIIGPAAQSDWEVLEGDS